MRLVRSIAAALLFVALSLSAVTAADPPRLEGTVYDDVGTLSGQEDRIEAAARSLKSERDITLYVVWLNRIDGEDPGAFVDRIAALNELNSGRNVLLMVSMEDRKSACGRAGRPRLIRAAGHHPRGCRHSEVAGR